MKIFDANISGSLNVSGAARFFGDLQVDGTINATISGTTSNALTLNTTGSARFATTGSNLFTANQTISGSIIPSVNNAYDLGDATHWWKDIYVSTGSIFIGGIKAISTNSDGTIQVGAQVVQTSASLASVGLPVPPTGSAGSSQSTIVGSQNITGSQSITGSLNVSGSLAVRGLTSLLQANVVTYDTVSGQFYYTASSAFGGGSSGVTQILTGSGISISPSSGVGVVTISATGGGPSGDFVTTSSFNSYTGSSASTFAGTAATASYSSNFVIANTLTLNATSTEYAAISPSTSPGPNNLFTLNTGSFTSAFGKYTIFSGSNSRSGEFVTSWNGTTTSYYDNSTVDIGNTSAITFVSAIVSGEIEINTGASTPSGWQVKMLATFM